MQREVVDPATYVEMWLKDAGMQGGADYVRRYDTWLAWFEEQRIEAVGFGWINLRRTDAERPEVRFEEWPYDVEQPIAPTIADWGRAVEDLRSLDDDALGARHLVARPDVRQETVGEPGAEDPEHIVLRQQRGLRRARTADTVEAALVGACDGDLSVDAILGALGRAARAATRPRPGRRTCRWCASCSPRASSSASTVSGSGRAASRACRRRGSPFGTPSTSAAMPSELLRAQRQDLLVAGRVVPLPRPRRRPGTG